MIYACELGNGSVTIFKDLIPEAVEIGGVRYPRTPGQSIPGVLMFEIDTARVKAWGDVFQAVFGARPEKPAILGLKVTLPVPLSDLQPDSMPGVTFVFPSRESITAPRKYAPDHPVRQFGVTRHVECKLADLPAHGDNGEYRAARKLDGTAIVIDMPKARELHRNRIRAARLPLMEALDVEQKRALVARDDAKVAEIEAKLQTLRDAPADPAIEAAATVDELKAVGLIPGSLAA